MSLCGVSLNFAIGRFHLLYIYLGYFKNPEIFILNWLPVLAVQLVLYAVSNRQWLAFLGASMISLSMSIGNYFKLILRSDPFVYEDISSIRAGLSIAGEYDIGIDWRILLAILFVMIATLILFFWAKGRCSPISRVLLIGIVFSSLVPFWRLIYSDGDRYYNNSYTNYFSLAHDRRDNYIANGFFYPFLFSKTQGASTAPAGYNEQREAEIFSQFKNAEIPDEKKLNIMIIQLESFCDLSAAGLEGINERVYQPLHQMQDEALSGEMIADVIGGGTIYTERSVLTGSCRHQEYFKPSYSYIHYMNAQGFFTAASHPNSGDFYARNTVNCNLGFQEFYNLENYFGKMTFGEKRCDAVYLPEVFRMFCEKIENSDKPVFSFNVSLQGHSPYRSDSFERETNLWTGENVSDSTRYVLNNYLSLVAETQRILKAELDKVADIEAPAVVMFYGDHKPWFGDEVYEELGMRISMETEQGMRDYLATPYVIWANAAAKALLQNDFSGIGPTVSPGYMMNILFDELGWDGPAFMSFTRKAMTNIPVICARGGYIEEDSYRRKLSETGSAMLNEYRLLQYYLHYRPELSE